MSTESLIAGLSVVSFLGVLFAILVVVARPGREVQRKPAGTVSLIDKINALPKERRERIEVEVDRLYADLSRDQQR